MSSSISSNMHSRTDTAYMPPRRTPAKALSLLGLLGLTLALAAQPSGRIRLRDRARDVLMTTTQGELRLRLSDATPLHRDNFIRLVRSGFYRGILFHRVIQGFMAQAGDPRTRPTGTKGLGRTDSAYTLPAEFRPELFHHRGTLAAARMGDDVNPAKASSGTQFYIVQGRVFTPASLDSVETYRLRGRKLPPEHRQVYMTQGGAPHLDQNYTVFGEVVMGMDVIDRTAALPTSGRSGGDKPLTDVRILRTKMVRRK
jgi:cyclophilin family peptidyl-prolyl cis-trans isomerase